MQAGGTIECIRTNEDELFMRAPQIIVIVLFALSLGASMASHGKPSRENFVNSLIGALIMMSLLYWGGFWSVK